MWRTSHSDRILSLRMSIRTSSSMDLQEYLVAKFKSLHPPAPAVLARGRGDITLSWSTEPFAFLGDRLLYRVEKNNKLPKWIVVYSGGKTTKTIDNLAPRHPHKFRLKVILKTEAVSLLSELALKHYGDERSICDNLEDNEELEEEVTQVDEPKDSDVNNETSNDDADSESDSGKGDMKKAMKKRDIKDIYEAVKILMEMKKLEGSGDYNNRGSDAPKWIESKWSEETWTNTDTEGSSATCFCMAVKCGYLKQVQTMLDERPELIGIVNSRNGLTPLATAVRQGDINTVRFLIATGAEVEQPSSAGQTPLHMAVLAGDLDLVDLLIEKGADMRARDWNGLRAEHYAVDSGSLEMIRYILDRGDVYVRDTNAWTPLFRALCQGAKTAIVEELVSRGSDIDAVDNAGLPLSSVAKLLVNRHGRSRDSIIRLVDSQYPHEKALANFNRLTKKIYHVHTLFKH